MTRGSDLVDVGRAKALRQQAAQLREKALHMDNAAAALAMLETADDMDDKADRLEEGTPRSNDR